MATLPAPGLTRSSRRRARTGRVYLMPSSRNSNRRRVAFPAEGLRFLRQLKRNNNRDWFAANKPVYEEFVRTPMAELVIAIGEELRRFAPEIVADPKRSVYRIY